MAFVKPFYSLGALLLLLVAATACFSSPFMLSPQPIPSSERISSNGNNPEILGKLKVKTGAARLLANGNTISRTQGDLKINGFNARLKFRNISVQANRAYGLKAERKVKMPFTRGLASISNRAAAASLPSGSSSGDFQPLSSSSSGTVDERRNRIVRILRAVLPAIRQRLLLLRLRSQQMLRYSVAPKPESTTESEALTPCSTCTLGSFQREQPTHGGPAVLGGALGSASTSSKDVNSLREENAKLRKMVSILSVAVRGVLRYNIKLRQEMQQMKQKQLSASQNGDLSESSDAGESPLTASTTDAMGPSSLDGQPSPSARRIILLRQYPSPVSETPLN